MMAVYICCAGNGPPGVQIPSRPGDNDQGYPASQSAPTTVDNNDPATTGNDMIM